MLTCLSLVYVKPLCSAVGSDQLDISDVRVSHVSQKDSERLMELLAMVGSLRKDSFNLYLAETMKRMRLNQCPGFTSR
jgi:hypothetical protein